MPIRPIDMISIAPRSQEASQQHVGDQNKMAHAQENVAQQFSKHVKESAEIVVKSSKGEEKEYRYDAKEKGNGRYRGSGKKEKKQSKEEQKKSKTGKESGFDIKI